MCQAQPTSFSVYAPPDVVKGAPFNFDVVAFDINDKVATGDMAAVHFTSSENGANLPADTTLTDGMGTFSVLSADPRARNDHGYRDGVTQRQGLPAQLPLR